MSNKTYQKLTYVANQKLGDVISLTNIGLDRIGYGYTAIDYSFDIIQDEIALYGGRSSRNGGDGDNYYPIIRNNTYWKVTNGTTAKCVHQPKIKYRFSVDNNWSDFYVTEIDRNYTVSSQRSGYNFHPNTTTSIYVFAGNNKGEIEAPCLAKVYRIYMKDHYGVEVELIPAKRISDGKIGLLDILSGKFYSGLTEDMEFIGPTENVFYDENGQQMETITEGVNSISETKQLIKEAIIAKGVEVLDTDSFKSYASKINEIKGNEKELAVANARIAELEAEIAEANAIIDQLNGEEV